MHTTVTVSSQPLPDLISQQQQAIAFVSQFLWQIAAVRKKTSFSALHKKVGTFLGSPISLTRFEEILREVNRQSWRQHKCLLTAIVLCKGGMPGGKFFSRAKELGLISEFPKDDYMRKDCSISLQREVFFVSKSIAPIKS